MNDINASWITLSIAYAVYMSGTQPEPFRYLGLFVYKTAS